MSTKISIGFWQNDPLGFHLFLDCFDDEHTGPLYLELTGCDFQAESARKTLVVELPRKLALELGVVPKNKLENLLGKHDLALRNRSGLVDAPHVGLERGANVEAALRAEIERLRGECAEAYQIVGALADVAGAFETDAVVRILDNLMAAAVGTPRKHEDVLPFVISSRTDGHRQL
jgi:hypothetical protein